MDYIEGMSNAKVVVTLLSSLGIVLYSVVKYVTNVIRDYLVRQNDETRLNDILRNKKEQILGAITFGLFVAVFSFLVALIIFAILSIWYSIKFYVFLLSYISLSCICICITLRKKNEKKLCISYKGRYWAYVNITDDDMYIFRSGSSRIKNLILIDRKTMTESIHGFIENDKIDKYLDIGLINVAIFDDNKFDIDEQLFLIYMVEVNNFRKIEGDLSAGKSRESVHQWEEKNNMIHYLSRKYSDAIGKLQHKGLLKIIESVNDETTQLYEMEIEYFTQLKRTIYGNINKVKILKELFI